jgi:hypothetical protein
MGEKYQSFSNRQKWWIFIDWIFNLFCGIRNKVTIKYHTKMMWLNVKQTIVDHAKSIATTIKLPMFLWIDVLNTNTYLINWNPSKSMDGVAPKHV